MAATSARRWWRLASAMVAALVLLQLLWETLLAPLRPGGSWLALKALPLALLWPGLARGRARTATALLLLLYFTEGVVRAFSETGRHALVAALATLLCVLAFAGLYFASRAERAVQRASRTAE